MYASKFLVSLALLVLPAQVVAQCQNDEAFRIFDTSPPKAKERSCRNIRLQEARRLLLCKDASVNAACPQTCGTCCSDSTTYIFFTNDGENKTCVWLAAQDESTRGEYCITQAMTANQGRTVRDGCPVACGVCQTEVSSVTGSPTISAAPSKAKSAAPSGNPTSAPSGKPSVAPTGKPSISPTDAPSRPPSPQPSPFPTTRPTFVPSQSPSRKPSQVPSDVPSLKPSQVPSDVPSLKPSQVPSDVPSLKPSQVPSLKPSQVPSDVPSQVPSDLPSLKPSQVPSDVPSQLPSGIPSSKPSQVPSDQPSNKPTVSIKPSASPSKKPSDPPNPSPSKKPSSAPSDAVVVVTSCVNTDYTFPLINDPTAVKDCLWLIENNAKLANRRANYCSDTVIKTNCAQACGECSTPTDSPAFKFKLKNLKNDVAVIQKCAWITANSKADRLAARMEYCLKPKIKVGCAATCA